MNLRIECIPGSLACLSTAGLRLDPGGTITKGKSLMSNKPAILAEGLHKHYGKTHALDGLDLIAEEGTVLGLLGPNGAGKTTAVRILTTLIRPDAGRARVAGFDVVADRHRVRRSISLTGQYASVDETLTGVENLVLIGRLLGV